MEEKSIIFKTAEDAVRVAQQLPDAKVIGTQVLYTDKRALELAMATIGVSGYTNSQNGRQYYPKHQREYEGDRPSIYVACLSAYNCGHLHGLWIDATQEAESIQDDINWMLSYSPVAHLEACEEWAIHDSGGFGAFTLREYESLEIVSAVANAIEEHGEAFGAFVDCEFPAGANCNWDGVVDIDWETVVEMFQSAYLGHYDSEKDFVLKSPEIDEMYDFAGLQKAYPFWSGHIDWESVAVDLFCQDYYSVKATDKGYGVYVFRNCP
jgi:antirestriction protein